MKSAPASLGMEIEMSDVPGRETFESMYAGKPAWDIGRPQRAIVEVADRVTATVLDAGCGTGDIRYSRSTTASR